MAPVLAVLGAMAALLIQVKVEIVRPDRSDEDSGRVRDKGAAVGYTILIIASQENRVGEKPVCLRVLILLSRQTDESTHPDPGSAACTTDKSAFVAG